MGFFDFLGLLLKVTFLFLQVFVVLVNMPAGRRSMKASPFQQTLEDFYRALQAISLEYFGVCPVDLQN